LWHKAVLQPIPISGSTKFTLNDKTIIPDITPYCSQKGGYPAMDITFPPGF
jgi:hypothetical protein